MQTVIEFLANSVRSTESSIREYVEQVEQSEKFLAGARAELANARIRLADKQQALEILRAVNGTRKDDPRKDPYAEAQAAGQVSREGGGYALGPVPDNFVPCPVMTQGVPGDYRGGTQGGGCAVPAPGNSFRYVGGGPTLGDLDRIGKVLAGHPDDRAGACTDPYRNA